MNIVFVHLNTRIPLFLRNNILDLKTKFPDKKIVLIHNLKQKVQVKGAEIVYLSRNEEEEEMERKYGYPKDFRGNFWFSSLVRFSMLNRFIQNSLEPVLHIESDILVARDFPFAKFDEIKNLLAFSIVSHQRGISSLLFINNEEGASKLWAYAMNMVNVNSLASDMEILFNFEKDFPQDVCKLPIAPSSLYIPDAFSLEEKEKNESRIMKFGGVFDGHDFGVFLGGTNPWNSFGISRLHTFIPESMLNFKITHLKFNSRRKFLDIKQEKGNLSVNLFSLHMTNKSSILFLFRTQSLALRSLTHFPLRMMHKIIHPEVFIIMLYKFVLKRLKRVLKISE